MNPATRRASSVLLPIIDCWNIIGVKGDHACPKLATVVHCHNCEVFAEAAQTFLDRPGPEGYVGAATRQLASVELAAAPDTLSVLVFEVAAQWLAIDTSAVVEVTEELKIHRMAHRSGRVFSGIVNIHGQLELCASLTGLLQVESDRDGSKSLARDARMLLVQLGSDRWVFRVDRVHGVRRIAPADVIGVPATALHDAASYVKNVLRGEGHDIGYLALDKTFGALGMTLR